MSASYDFKHECGLFGVSNHHSAVGMTFGGLMALQHRGQESAGIATPTNDYKAMGLVNQVFNQPTLDRLAIDAPTTAIGQVRYSTAGQSTLINAQPLVSNTRFGSLKVAMNGNIVNHSALREKLSEESGAIFSTTTDTEILLHLITHSPCESLEDALIEALSQMEGGYCFLLLAGDTLYAIRDPNGVRPLSLANKDSGFVIASETAAFNNPLVGAKFVRDVEPGEILILTPHKEMKSLSPFPKARQVKCVFEHIYFARPDSEIFGRPVAHSRYQLGYRLGREAPVGGAIVMGVPDSGLFAAPGYAEATGCKLVTGLVRDHYMGRTFIWPDASERAERVRLKLSPVRSLIEGQVVVLVDDSIVRGTTSREIVRMVREAGAREVHMRITSPPTKFSCYYGVDTPTQQELVAARFNHPEIEKFIEADTLSYLSLAATLEACGQAPEDAQAYCHACFSGAYLIASDLIQLHNNSPKVTV